MTDEQLRDEVVRRHTERYPHGCPMVCEACVRRLGIQTETERAQLVRNNIARHYGHETAVARG